MGVVIKREEWALTPLAYPLLSAAGLATALLLPYFSAARTPAHAARSSPSPFDVGAGPFLRFRCAFLIIFPIASVVEGIHAVFREDEFVRCGLGRDQMAARLASTAAAALSPGAISGVVSDKMLQATERAWILAYSVKVLPFNYDQCVYGFREYLKKHGFRKIIDGGKQQVMEE